MVFTLRALPCDQEISPPIIAMLLGHNLGKKDARQISDGADNEFIQ
jgi:hypothetical protein